MDLLLNLRDFSGAAGDFDVVEVLQVEPELRVRVEVTRQAQSCLSGDAAASMHNFADAGCWYVEFESELVDGKMERLHKVLAEDFAGMDRRHKRFVFFHIKAPLLVIIHDFNSVTVAVTPDKADAPLLIDANRMLSLAISF